MAQPVRTYGYINAKLRARLSKEVTEEQFSQMIHAHDLNETLQILVSTEYSDLPKVYHETGDIKMVELSLLDHAVASLKEIRRFIEEEVRSMVDGFLEQYEVEIVKDALRLWFDRTIRQRDISDSASYIYREKVVHDIDVDGVISANTREEVLHSLDGSPYHTAVEEWMKERAFPGSVYPLEARLDKDYFQRLKNRLEGLDRRDREIAGRIIGIQIDMENIMRLGRFIRFYKDEGEEVRGSFISGGRSVDPGYLNSAFGASNPLETLQSGLRAHYGGGQVLDQVKGKREDAVLLLILSLLEEIFEKELNKLLLGYPFTIGVILAYCFRKRAEVRKVVTVINGKKYGVDENRLMQIL